MRGIFVIVLQVRERGRKEGKRRKKRRKKKKRVLNYSEGRLGVGGFLLCILFFFISFPLAFALHFISILYPFFFFFFFVSTKSSCVCEKKKKNKEKKATTMEDITHPPMEQLQDLEYCIDSNPSWAETILLAFQNYILMLGTNVMIPSLIVPAMGGDNGDKARVIQTLLFVAGLNTLLQALFGTRLPAVVGGSFAYVVPIAYIVGDSSLQRITDSHERFLHTMRAIQGALIVASSIQIILGYSQVWGLLSRFFSPLGMAPVVGLVGLGLFQRGFPVLGECVEIGLPMLILVIGSSQYLKHVRLFRDLPIFERFPVLICVTIVWIYSVILTASGAYRHKPIKTQLSCRTDRANLITTAPWFKFPYPLQWGPPTFSAGHSFAMMAAVFVSMVESTGAYKAAARLAIATPPPAYVLSRGIGWQGIGVLLNGLFGTTTGATVAVENVGLLGLTRVGSRRVVQISAGFMIFFSTLGKFGAVFASIPIPIFAALYCVLFGLVASVGLSFLQFTNMNSMRNLIITGLSLFLGLSIPQFFNEYWNPTHRGLVHSNAGWFNAIMNTIFSSQVTVSLAVAVLLDNTLEVEKSKKDRGMPWWVKFRTFRGDNRNEEFYTLPFNLNRFFPPT
ncbi:nucleobase-ascorbate transporter 1-like [Cucurbita maxima]|uniref:Nucleobase-ascorbate transporter 1-like n=1 Tax=Cucurbita maxima TaxID=3661 RepID=A0A6J1JCN3_CUCMA|nr:nucleobase-ascorbate transporter 1-like [Cucurbita maxima]